MVPCQLLEQYSGDIKSYFRRDQRLMYMIYYRSSQQYKPLPDGEGVQPLSLLFHEQSSEVKLQPSTRIANKKNKSGILYWIMNTSNEQEYFYMQPGLSYLRYELR